MIDAILTLSLLAQQRPDPLPAIPRLEVRRAANPLSIDGKLNDSAWAQAEAVTFQFPWPNQTGAKQKTTVRLLWDDKYLYLGYDCEDADITAQYTHRDDPTYKDDAVEAFINPAPAQTDVYLGFEMNARAVMYDYVYLAGKFLFKRLDLDGLQLATHIDGTLNARGDKDKGWSLEVAIPFAEFEPLFRAARPREGDQWAINLNRWDGTEPDRRLSQWSDSGLVAANPHNPRRFGTMVFRER
ncbi:MAG: carbohydrate-binding family 9-like protein [Bryobacter sp.]|jgi:hypothetical protein|nr:carbohydrate-binding family 9-like protein [Bryobacter sp. CoA8 C33]